MTKSEYDGIFKVLESKVEQYKESIRKEADFISDNPGEELDRLVEKVNKQREMANLLAAFEELQYEIVLEGA